MSRSVVDSVRDPAASEPGPMLSAHNLGISRRRPSGDDVMAFEGLTFDVGRGEFACLIGPSGCGKSSTLSVLAGLERPTTGTVLVDGRPVTGPGPDRALLFQEPALFPWLSVRANVELALRLAGVPRTEWDERATTWLARMEIDRVADRQPHELSAGMRQRAALARALACGPKVLLGDEPFGATTFVFATHNVREAVLLADRVFVMSAAPGTLLEEFRIEARRPRSLEDALISRVVSEVHDLLIRQVRDR